MTITELWSARFLASGLFEEKFFTMLLRNLKLIAPPLPIVNDSTPYIIDIRQANHQPKAGLTLSRAGPFSF